MVKQYAILNKTLYRFDLSTGEVGYAYHISIIGRRLLGATGR